MSKYTPGPWRIYPSITSWRTYTINMGDKTIPLKEEEMANAKLISIF